MIVSRHHGALARVALSFLATAGCRDAHSAPSGPPPVVGREDITLRSSADSGARFKTVSGLARLPDGRIVVADDRRHHVQVFSATGAYQFDVAIDTMVADPCCLAVASDSALWVLEPRAKRYVVFRLGAASATTSRVIPLPVAVSGLQRSVLWDEQGRPVELSEAHLAGGETIVIRTSVAPDGAIARQDTIAPPAGARGGIALIASKDGHRTTGVTQPFGAAFLHAHGSRGEVATAVATNYRIDVAESPGRHLLIQRSVPPVNVTRRERQRAEGALARLARNLGLPRRAIPFDVPDQKAPLDELQYDAEGRLWAIRATEDGENARADVYDRVGRLVTSVAWPKNVVMSPSSASGRVALGMAVVPSGEWRVMRYIF